jgi:hypothetical protein
MPVVSPLERGWPRGVDTVLGRAGRKSPLGRAAWADYMSGGRRTLKSLGAALRDATGDALIQFILG